MESYWFSVWVKGARNSTDLRLALAVDTQSAWLLCHMLALFRDSNPCYFVANEAAVLLSQINDEVFLSLVYIPEFHKFHGRIFGFNLQLTSENTKWYNIRNKLAIGRFF